MISTERGHDPAEKRLTGQVSISTSHILQSAM
jgi:hypothetical protein